MHEHNWRLTMYKDEFRGEERYFAQEIGFWQYKEEVVIRDELTKEEALALLATIGNPKMLSAKCYRVVKRGAELPG